jgi:serine/threonine-protein kinase
VSITIGTPLGSYEITALLGKGGMGEVYRARDTRLKRDVAIKILPDEFSRDPDRVTRFEREAQVLALLNDSRIGAIYGLEEFKGTRFLVLELVNGPTLAERIARGALPPEEALVIAAQIADALEYAHERNVIHRDLKPANIKLTDGSVKVLDFGLAKALADPVLSTDPADSPTFSTGPTVAGVILGTAAYMSPEQAQGKPLDKRTDIWSFGVVLYEMFTGKPPFGGETAADALASILKEAPDLDRVPAKIRPLLQKCLEKDRRQRLRDIGDAKLLLDHAPSEPEARQPLSWIAAAALASIFAVIAGIGWWRATRPALHPLVRISAELSPIQVARYRLDSETTLASGQPGTHLALSPDGTRLASPVLDTDGQIRLATRRLDEKTFVPLRGAENASAPFFSPDGQWIAFFAAGKLKKIPALGGAAITLGNALAFSSGTWGDDGNIIAALDGARGPLSRVPSGGGTPTSITELTQGDLGHESPQVLPGSKAVLFTVFTSEGYEDFRIDVLSFATHQRKTIIRGGIMGRYLTASNGAGYLVYVHQDTLLAAPFDPGKLAVTGVAQPILDDISGITVSNFEPDFDFSRNGTFVYFSGKGEPERSIFWLDSAGQIQPLHSSPGFYSDLRFSPDGRHLVFGMGALPQGGGLWIQDTERKPSVRLTFLPGVSGSPVWSPDGTHILFASGGHPNQGIYWVRSDGVGEPQRVSKIDGALPLPTAFSPDGKLVIFESGNPFTAMDVWTARFEGTAEHPQLGKPEPYLHARGFPMPAFSPDGHWLAYASEEGGRREVYVQPFPGPGGKVPISIDGGGFPQWSPNGHELFFLSLDRHIMVVDYTIKGNSLSPGTPRVWSKQQILLKETGGPFQPYALAPDGKRFAVILYPDGTTEHQHLLHLTFLLNFTDELRRRVSRE